MKTVASLGEDFWQITYYNASWTVKRISRDPDDWLIINHRHRTINNNTNLAQQLIRQVQRYEERHD